jgi:dUTP pyrophosphatase
MEKQQDIPYLKFIRLSTFAKPPFKASTKAAGYDLFSAHNITIKPRDKAIIPTGLIIATPEGTYGRIAPRSGLAAQHSINVGAGVIDADYRGPLNVLLFNHSDESFQVNIGDRIAQLICEKVEYPKLLEVETLDATARGSAGYGSSGRN